jgi:hypothetical protein
VNPAKFACSGFSEGQGLTLIQPQGSEATKLPEKDTVKGPGSLVLPVRLRQVLLRPETGRKSRGEQREILAERLTNQAILLTHHGIYGKARSPMSERW